MIQRVLLEQVVNVQQRTQTQMMLRDGRSKPHWHSMINLLEVYQQRFIELHLHPDLHPRALTQRVKAHATQLKPAVWALGRSWNWWYWSSWWLYQAPSYVTG